MVWSYSINTHFKVIGYECRIDWSVGFGVLTPVVMKDVTPSSRLKINLCCRGTSGLHLQGRRIRQPSNQGTFRRNVDRFSKELDGIIPLKIELRKYLWTLWFHKLWGISWLPERLLALQKGRCSLKEINFSRWYSMTRNLERRRARWLSR
jgi:hypothetical protein